MLHRMDFVWTVVSRHEEFEESYEHLNNIPQNDLVERHLSNIKIDWHDYEQIKREKERKGPGEQGAMMDFSQIDKKLLDKLYKENGYNGALSDIISLHRALPDVRHPDCSNILYKKDLPRASIVIPFHNEHFSVLLRTVWSVTERSPDQLIEEIVLVDDCSTKDFLKEELEEYLKKNIPKAKILRLKKRSGLIVARQEGARVAKGEVLIFLDAHCEANVNWLPPLLDIIADDYKTCVCPIIDGVHYDTYKYIPSSGGRGAFNWDMVYKTFPKFKKYDQLPTEPFPSPVMAGGLFAISANFFWELGGYDEGLQIWGGEQFELSFKLWQCGGRMLDVPCSRVGHMYRKFGAFTNPENNMNYLCMNFRRVIEVWMDDYKQYYYMRHPDCESLPQGYGDISKQLAIREKLNCKPFKWFLEEVAYEVTNRYPLIEPPNIAYGEIRNLKYPDICIETTDTTVGLNLCNKDSWSQKIQFTWKGEIKHEHSKNCWDIDPGNIQNNTIPMDIISCHNNGGNQLWIYDEETRTIKHGGYKTNCLDMYKNISSLFLKPCNIHLESQQWSLENFNKEQQNKVSEYMKNLVIDEKPSQ